LVLAVVTGAAILVLAPLMDRSNAATVADEHPAYLLDDLVQARLWQPTTEPDGRSSCVFSGALTVRMLGHGLYKCRGPQDDLPRDMSAAVNVRLLTPGACAAVWFRFGQNRGYQLRICRSSIYLGTHKSKAVNVFRTFPLDSPIEVGGPAVRIGLSAVRDTLEVTRDGSVLGTATLSDPEITGSRLLLGLYTDSDPPPSGPFSVAFDHIEVRDPGQR
ncbi:MAG TPA: serine/threonine protein kinase, partial [Actinoplanes sp.]